MTATILFVDDEKNLLQGLRRSLRTMRKEWDMHFAEGAKAGLEVLAEHKVDIVVSDMRMPEMDGAQFLEKTSRDYPSTARFVLSGQADRETTYRAIGPSHQFFSKPFDADTLVRTIKRILFLRAQVSPEAVEVISGLRSFPSPTDNREAFSAAIKTAQPSIDAVSARIAEDVGLSLKTLQLTNSTYFGIGADVFCARRAARMLDVNVLGDLVEQKRFAVPLAMDANDDAFKATGAAGLALAEACHATAKARGLSEDHQSLAAVAGLFSKIGELLTMTEHGHLLSSADDALTAYLLALWGMPPTLVDVFAPDVEENETAQLVRTIVDEAAAGAASDAHGAPPSEAAQAPMAATG